MIDINSNIGDHHAHAFDHERLDSFSMRINVFICSHLDQELVVNEVHDPIAGAK